MNEPKLSDLPDLHDGLVHLLYGHVGSSDLARSLALLEGVYHLVELDDVVVVEPLGFLRLMMTLGSGCIRQSNDCVEIYLNTGGSTLTLWPCTGP